MEAKQYLGRYRLRTDLVGIPLVIRRSADEATFQADDEQTGEQVALQVVPIGELQSDVREQLEAEAKAAKKLSHINIPALRDFGFEGDRLVYVTEYFDGTTAENWIKAQGPMPASVVLRIASQVVGALGAATFHGIVHHAVNPSNIMLVPGQTAEGEWPLIKVLNFVGVAPGLASEQADGSSSLNPSDFASPEQIESGEVDFRSQMYSLGCTLWFLLKGVPPTGGPAMVENAKGVAAPLRHLLASMLASNPADRPLDPLAFHQQIQDCLEQIEKRETVATKFGLPTAAPAPVLARPVIKDASPRGPLPWKPLALAALLLTIAAMTAMVLARRTHQPQAIGVPVGVPETTAAVVTVPTSSAAPIVAATNSSPTTQPQTEPPVLASVVSTEPSETSAPDESPQPESTQVAANTATAPPQITQPIGTNPPVPVKPQPSAAVVGSNIAPLPAEPPPPSEGPSNEITRPFQRLPEVTSTAHASSDRAKTVPEKPLRDVAAEEDVQKDVSIAEVGEIPGRATRVARTVKPVKKARVASAASLESSPPVPRGSVRARYLGTTPDGNLVFGLPTDERVYSAPPAASAREEKQRRRQRPVPRETVIENLPVLPALPPD